MVVLVEGDKVTVDVTHGEGPITLTSILQLMDYLRPFSGSHFFIVIDDIGYGNGYIGVSLIGPRWKGSLDCFMVTEQQIVLTTTQHGVDVRPSIWSTH